MATFFVYDGVEIAEALLADGSLKNRYLHGPVVDMILADETFDASSKAL